MRTTRPIAIVSLVVTLILWTAVVAEEAYDNTSTRLASVLEPPPDEGYSAGDTLATDESCSEPCREATDACGDEPCCDLSDCCYCPTWTFTAGALLMERTSPDDAVLVTETDDPASTEILNARDFDFDWRGGWELSAIRHNVRCSCWDLEARYFRIDGWRAVCGRFLSQPGAYQQYVIPIGNDEVPVEVSAIYESHLDGFELNLRRPVGSGRLTVLGGFRFVELDECGLTVTYDMGPGLNVATHQVRAINDLYGFQLGADACVWQTGWLSVDALFRAGAYGNRAVNSALVTQVVGPSFASRAADDHAAFLGELGLTGTCQLADSLALTAGYRLMWLEGVAVAPDQVGVSDPASGVATVDTGGSPLYHGVVISLEYSR